MTAAQAAEGHAPGPDGLLALRQRHCSPLGPTPHGVLTAPLLAGFPLSRTLVRLIASPLCRALPGPLRLCLPIPNAGIEETVHEIDAQIGQLKDQR